MSTGILVQFFQVDTFPVAPQPYSWYVRRIGTRYQLRVTDGSGNYKTDDRSDVVVSSLLEKYTIPADQRFIGMVAFIKSGVNIGKRYRMISEPGTTNTTSANWELYSTTEEVDLGNTQEIIDYLDNNLITIL